MQKISRVEWMLPLALMVSLWQENNVNTNSLCKSWWCCLLPEFNNLSVWMKSFLAQKNPPPVCLGQEDRAVQSNTVYPDLIWEQQRFLLAGQIKSQTNSVNQVSERLSCRYKKRLWISQQSCDAAGGGPDSSALLLQRSSRHLRYYGNCSSSAVFTPESLVGHPG